MSSLLCFCTTSGLLICSVVLLTGCDTATKPLRISGNTMGTTYHMVIVPTAEQSLPDDLDAQIAQRLADVNQHLSTYINDSELSLLNASQSSAWQPISETLAVVLADAIIVGAMTHGALDVTIGPLVDLWGFGPSTASANQWAANSDNLPSGAEIQSRLNNVGFQKLELHLNPYELRKPPAVKIDLSAIAKGFGVDHIGAYLNAEGIENYLVEIGGELLARGVNAEGNPWRIGIETPSLGHQGVQQAIAVTDKAIATSGDYRNYVEQNGRRYSHIIDPRTGWPIEHNLASITVIADTVSLADGLATGLFVLGEEEALQLAEQHNLAIFLIVKTAAGFETRFSPAFAAYLNEA